MKKLARYLLLLAAMGLGFAFASCKADDDDDTTYYTVSFNSDGGTEVKSQKVESGKKATKPADPTKQAIATETYAFDDWYTSTDSGTTLSDTAFDFNTPITKDITLYAKWTVNAVTHTVTFDTKGGSMSPAEQTIVHGNKAAKPTNPTKAATEAETYAFDNWYTSTDGGTTLSETAFDFDTAIEGDITLYAKWTVNAVTHTVTFDTKGGSTSPAEQTIVHGNKAAKPTNPTKAATEAETYAFDDWYTSTDGGATLSDTAFDFNTSITNDITLYAKWATNVVTHTVTFDSKNGSTAEIKTVNHGNKVERPTNPTKAATEAETYAFDNWYTSTDGGANLSETAFDFDTAIDKDITLYAKWTATAITHTVTFNTNGGSTSPAEQTIVHGKKATKPADPKKQATETETYAFDNWYTSTDGGTSLSDTAFDFDTAIDKDITLYAKWTATAITHTVTFNTNGGSTAPAEQTIVHGNKATRPTDPTKEETATEAFVFGNWYISTDGGANLSDTAFDFNTTIEGDITLYAKWKEADYIILKDCSEIRTMFETLCDYDSSSYPYKFNKTITRFAKADEKPSSADYYLDAAGNRIPLWYDEAATTLYYYLEPGKKMSLRTSDEKNSLFDYMTDATSIETKDFDTSKVTSMYYMFGKCSSLTALDVSNFDTSKVTSMYCMFYMCKALTSLDVSKFDTSKVTSMGYMFYMCKALTSLDVSKFDTSKVTGTGMYCMFNECKALTSLDVSKFDTSKVTHIGNMFYGCSSLTALDVSNFDTSKVTNMGDMFYGCTALITITASEKFVTDKVLDSSRMFKNCTSLKGGAGTVYDENHIDNEYARIDGGTENPGYFTAKTN